MDLQLRTRTQFGQFVNLKAYRDGYLTSDKQQIRQSHSHAVQTQEGPRRDSPRKGVLTRNDCKIVFDVSVTRHSL